LPSIFINNKLTLKPQKYTLLKQNNDRFSLFFVGGLVKNKMINHLDLVKLSNLDNSVYGNLIIQCQSPIVWFPLLKTIMEIKLLKCFENNFINLLHIHKNNLKKI